MIKTTVALAVVCICVGCNTLMAYCIYASQMFVVIWVVVLVFCMFSLPHVPEPLIKDLLVSLFTYILVIIFF